MELLQSLWASLGGQEADAREVEIVGAGSLPSVFAVTDLAAASTGVAALAVGELAGIWETRRPQITVDRRLASMWFGQSIRPDGWTLPPPWDPVAGDYRAANGWIRLHTNARPHRDAALAVLGVEAEREAVAKEVAGWRAEELEAAVVARGGCAVAMRTTAEWQSHPQGTAVAGEPLFHTEATDYGRGTRLSMTADRPLRGIRVLDLTRVLAGPIATRFLAGLGADVLRIDPPWWDEPGVVPEVTLGKRCTFLDLRDDAERGRFERLLGECDIFVHGLRADALSRLGLGSRRRREIRPGLIDVSLDAYGWTGPWAGRRGFDSLVQMSSGIAAAGMARLARDRPTPLPVQALDHAAGYLMAAAAIRGLTRRLTTGLGSETRTSLSAVATVLTGLPADPDAPGLVPETPADLVPELEVTAWGPARRLRPPVAIGGTPLRWERPAGALGSSEPAW